MRFKFLWRAIAIVMVLGLVGAACSKKKETVAPTPGVTGTSEAPQGQPGGSVTFGAEQWPICINPITQCSSATWLYFRYRRGPRRGPAQIPGRSPRPGRRLAN